MKHTNNLISIKKSLLLGGRLVSMEKQEASLSTIIK